MAVQMSWPRRLRGQYSVQRLLGRHQVLPTKEDRPIKQRIELVDRLTLQEVVRQGQHRLIAIIDLRRLLRMQRQHRQIALSVSPIAGWVKNVGAVRAQRTVI